MYNREPLVKQAMSVPAKRPLTPNNQAIVKATEANRNQFKSAAPVGGNMRMPTTPMPQPSTGPDMSGKRRMYNAAKNAVAEGRVSAQQARKRFNYSYPNNQA